MDSILDCPSAHRVHVIQMGYFLRLLIFVVIPIKFSEESMAIPGNPEIPVIPGSTETEIPVTSGLTESPSPPIGFFNAGDKYDRTHTTLDRMSIVKTMHGISELQCLHR